MLLVLVHLDTVYTVTDRAILMDNYAGTQSDQQQHNVVSRSMFSDSETKSDSFKVCQLTHLPTRHDVHLPMEQVWYTNIKGQYEKL